MLFFTTYTSPVGAITLASDGEKLIGSWIEGQKYHGFTLFKDMTERNDLPIFDMAKKWLDSYFAGEKPAVSQLPVAPIGSEFQQAVWGILCDIPYGKTVTYGDVAKKAAGKLGTRKTSARSVGGAIGRNPLSVIIPCHRVIGANNKLTGYSAGIDVKAKLLELEGVDVPALFL